MEWQTPNDCPEWWEGRQVWEWREGSPVRLTLAPLGYSRVPEHCAGIWWQLADVPLPPPLDLSPAKEILLCSKTIG
jgi:hypothetical protein